MNETTGGDLAYERGPLETWDSYIRRVPYMPPPGGEWRVLSHDSYEMPTRLYETEEERRELMAAAERVIDRMLDDPEGYFCSAEQMTLEDMDRNIKEAKADPVISAALGLSSNNGAESLEGSTAAE